MPGPVSPVREAHQARVLHNSLRALSLLSSLMLLATSAGAECHVRVSDTGVAGRVEIDWCVGKEKEETSRRLGRRVDERVPVTITSKNFNFLHYGLDYKVDDKIVEAYVTLNALWSQIFQIGGLVAGLSDRAVDDAVPHKECGDFQSCVARWLWDLQIENDALGTIVASVAEAGTGLPEDQRNSVERYSAAVPAKRVALNGARGKAQADHPPRTVAQIDLFVRVDAAHRELLEKLSAFQVAAGLIKNGQEKVIEKRKAGTLVTITVSPKSRFDGLDGGKPASIEYFVHSRFGLVYHMGYSYSRLRDFDFEKVRAISGQDLFSQTKNQKDINAFTAFLGFPLKTSDKDGGKLGLFATLGTDIEKPGDRLYGALSVRFAQRVMLNAGYATSTLKEGKSRIVEQIGDRLGTRELFNAIETRRQWEPFFAVSFTVF